MNVVDRSPDLLGIELFSGVGMLGEGVRAGFDWLGRSYRAVCNVEREIGAAGILAARMEEGAVDRAPVWSDVRTFDARSWHGCVDFVVAGFPCQDLSIAGRRAGLDGARSGLFFEVLRIADDCGAWGIVLENVAGIATATASVVDEAEGDLDERAVSRVVGELADRGWNAEWITLAAGDVGASHKRERWFCFAWRTMDDSTGARRDRARERAAAVKHGRECVPCARCADLGDAGLQHLDAQQWPDGAESARAGGTVADAERIRCQRWGISGVMGGARGNSQGETRQRQRSRNVADCCECDVADAQRCGSAPRIPTKAGRDEKPTEPAKPDDCGSRQVFAPGPDDPRWAAILAESTGLAPALEPGFRGVVDGLAVELDIARPQRLRACGNGVVALCAAAAIVELVRRANGG